MESLLVEVKFFVGLQLLLMFTGAGGLRDVQIQVPQAVLTGSSATLLCRYNLEGDLLYTIKWYKGRDEFFRYVPKEHPHTRVFPLPGVIVDIDASGRDRVTLIDVAKPLAGKYRCEVSTDAPDFHTVVVSAHLQVLDKPVGVPEVMVAKSSYSVGDVLKANCSLPWSAVRLNVTWLINGLKVNESEYVDLTDSEETNGTTMGLQTEVCKGGRLRLQCVASLYDVYSSEAEVWLEEDRPRLASVLGTRESSAGSNSCKTISFFWTLTPVFISRIICS